MKVQVNCVDLTTGSRYYSELEDWDVRDVYQAARKEYGRCTGKIYIDSPTGPRPIGWVFVRRLQYERSSDTYLRETWVVPYARYEKHTTIEVEYAIGDTQWAKT